MDLSHTEKLVLGFFYHRSKGGFLISEAYSKLNLDSGEEKAVKQELTSQHLIHPVVTTQEGSYYKIREQGRKVYEALP